MAARQTRQFDDEWVENATLLALYTKGGCSCCGISAAFDAERLAAQCSDLDSAARHETLSVWPADVQDDVWHDRVALRRLLKARAVELQDALTRLGSRLDRLWLHSLSSDQRAAVTALRTQEVHAHLAQHCGLKPATQLVLVNVLRQLANFALTGYEDPPHSESEKEFNRALRASEDGFSAAREYLDGEPGSMASFLARIRELARTKSLSRRRSAPDGVPRVVSSQAVAPAAAAAAPAAAASTASQGTAVAGDSSGDEHGHEAGAPASRPVERKAQSFRADRRLLRLLIAQLMAERAVAAAAAAAAAAGAASA